jgi:hypothetical protein
MCFLQLTNCFHVTLHCLSIAENTTQQTLGMNECTLGFVIQVTEHGPHSLTRAQTPVHKQPQQKASIISINTNATTPST